MTNIQLRTWAIPKFSTFQYLDQIDWSLYKKHSHYVFIYLFEFNSDYLAKLKSVKKCMWSRHMLYSTSQPHIPISITTNQWQRSKQIIVILKFLRRSKPPWMPNLKLYSNKMEKSTYFSSLSLKGICLRVWEIGLAKRVLLKNLKDQNGGDPRAKGETR